MVDNQQMLDVVGVGDYYAPPEPAAYYNVPQVSAYAAPEYPLPVVEEQINDTYFISDPIPYESNGLGKQNDTFIINDLYQRLDGNGIDSQHDQFFMTDFLSYLDGNTNAEIDTTNESDSPHRLIGTDSPFAIFADALRASLSGGAPRAQEAQVVAVPTGGGGVNIGVVVIALVLVGGGIWWYSNRKGASNGN